MKTYAAFTLRRSLGALALAHVIACGGRTDDTQAPDDPFDATGGATATATSFAAGGNLSSGTGSGTQAAQGGSFDMGGKSPISSAPVSTTLIDAGAATCGNGRLDPGEECDYSIPEWRNACEKGCRLNPWGCGVGCVSIPICGNQKIEEPEECDDGNALSGDGCTGTCVLEKGHYCTAPGQHCLPLNVPPDCGDGVVDPTIGELCDDGVLNGQPGNCPANCGRVGTCGNGVWEPWSGEACDDGVNAGTYGGCMPDCTLAARCGDGVLDCPEECDLGADNSPLDKPEYGSCLSTCMLGPYCGDGIVQGPEECDWGDLNGTLDQGCSTFCRYVTWLP